MRTFIIIVVALLTPFAMWTAGCRENKKQAAFPKGPEVKKLARAPEQRSSVPEIAAAPATIDPEILHSPDQPTFARIRAVMDKEAQMTSRDAAPGLLVLPRQDVSELAVLPEPTPVYGAPVPQVTNAEFRSRPAAPLPERHSRRQAPAADVSAMMPPARPPTAVMAEPSLPTESIPGVYMGSDQIGAGGTNAWEPPAPPEGTARWIGMGPDQNKIGGPDALTSPPLLSTASFEAVSIDDLNQLMRDLGPVSPSSERDASNELRQALAPLPTLAELAVWERAAPLPEPIGELSPAPALSAAAPATGKAPSNFPADMPVLSAPPLVELPGDLRLAGIPESKMPEAPPVLDLLIPESIAHQALPVPPLEQAVAASAAVTTAQVEPAPQKVSLLPKPILEKTERPSSAGLDKIDSAVEVPPMVF